MNASTRELTVTLSDQRLQIDARPVPSHLTSRAPYLTLILDAALPDSRVGNCPGSHGVPAGQQYRTSLPHFLDLRLADRGPEFRHHAAHRHTARRGDLFFPRLGA